MLLALIADSHGLLPPALFERLDGAERILHLGDLGPTRLLAELEAVAPTLAVGGNTDPAGHPELPAERCLTVDGLALFMRHHPWPEREIDPAAEALYLHGHEHMPRLLRMGRAGLICPGAVRSPRGGHPASLGLIEITAQIVYCTLIALENGSVLAQKAWTRP